MPTYEYECRKCGDVFEKFQSMKDAVIKKCPKCKGSVRRLIGAGSGIIFKGTGFYETDYKKKSGEKPAPPCPASSEACKNCPSKKGKKH